MCAWATSIPLYRMNEPCRPEIYFDWSIAPKLFSVRRHRGANIISAFASSWKMRITCPKSLVALYCWSNWWLIHAGKQIAVLTFTLSWFFSVLPFKEERYKWIITYLRYNVSVIKKKISCYSMQSIFLASFSLEVTWNDQEN